jgi:hypothetical protein
LGNQRAVGIVTELEDHFSSYLEKIDPLSLWVDLFQCQPGDTDITECEQSAAAAAIETVLEDMRENFAERIGLPELHSAGYRASDELLDKVRRKLFAAAVVEHAGLRANKVSALSDNGTGHGTGLVAIMVSPDKTRQAVSGLLGEAIGGTLKRYADAMRPCPVSIIHGRPQVSVRMAPKTEIRERLGKRLDATLKDLLSNRRPNAQAGLLWFEAQADTPGFLAVLDEDGRTRLDYMLQHVGNKVDLGAKIDEVLPCVPMRRTFLQDLLTRACEYLDKELHRYGMKKLPADDDQQTVYVGEYRGIFALDAVMHRLFGDEELLLEGVCHSMLFDLVVMQHPALAPSAPDFAVVADTPGATDRLVQSFRTADASLVEAGATMARTDLGQVHELAEFDQSAFDATRNKLQAQFGPIIAASS